MRIASPCPARWEDMSGGEKSRFCEQCGLHVYNLSQMTRAEAQSLVANTEKRICAKVYRRADGKVLTKDCPVGLQSARKRAVRLVSAGFAAILSLCSVTLGQSRKQESQSRSSNDLKIKRTTTQTAKGLLQGVVTDSMGAVVPGAKVSLMNEQTQQKVETVTTEEGRFKSPEISAGTYTIKVEIPGFKLLEIKHFAVKHGEEFQIEAILQVIGELMGVFVDPEPSLLEIKPGEVRLGEGLIQKLPLK